VGGGRGRIRWYTCCVSFWVLQPVRQSIIWSAEMRTCVWAVELNTGLNRPAKTFAPPPPQEASYARGCLRVVIAPAPLGFLSRYLPRYRERGFDRGSGGFTWKVLQQQASYTRKLLPENRMPLPKGTEFTEKVVRSSVITGSWWISLD
jgi:hypothetical protein